MGRISAEMLRARHSRRVRILKVSLPLVAVAILSSLFLFSKSITMEGALPFAEIDIQDRLREPKMTEVRVATTSETGAIIDISAASITPTGLNRATARTASGTINKADGQGTSIRAAQIKDSETAALAALLGGVTITSGGYDMATQALDVDITDARIDSRSTVTAKGPLGTLEAGRMRLQQTKAGAVLVFNSGVRLIYTPNEGD